MSVAASGVALTYVARQITGTLETFTRKYDEKKQEIVRIPHKIVDPVIVFFPNGSSQVLSTEEADKRGFFKTPTIMNFETVMTPDSPAGKVKFAMMEDEKRENWLLLEQELIAGVVSRFGYPLEEGLKMSEKSLYIKQGEVA